MKAKYIGQEDMPGSKSTVLYGMRVKCGEVFEVPRGLEGKAKLNPHVEVVSDAPEPKKSGPRDN